jgi:hypothetical protein
MVKIYRSRKCCCNLKKLVNSGSQSSNPEVVVRARRKFFEGNPTLVGRKFSSIF